MGAAGMLALGSSVGVLGALLGVGSTFGSSPSLGRRILIGRVTRISSKSFTSRISSPC